jgi:tetratricopeptide (TPR) repeat protein/predicted Ser/Thr protein kinase
MADRPSPIARSASPIARNAAPIAHTRGNDWSRIKELFHAALERTPDERTRYLDATCADAAELRAEVERLLTAHAQAGEFIERSPIRRTDRVIGHYQLERPIGAGGMGEVYLARDLELGRTVAIKIALEADDAAHVRLKREAQHASQLNHPHICTIYEVAADGGQPFIAMEYVEGRRLSEVIADGGLPAADVRRYGMQIADALAHAHRHGVLHRDLTPANVMVTSEHRVKVLDFGLARQVSPEKVQGFSESQESITTGDSTAGTLACMAPELLRGGAADARSDIWALGVLLYQMASGRRPFTGATGFELSGAILYEAPAPLPASVPPPIRAIVARCLEKDPAARCQTAGEVAAALDERHPPKPVRQSRTGAAWPSRLSRRWQVAMASILALALAYGAYRALRPGDTPVASGASGRPAIAVLRFDHAGARDGEWMSQGIPNMLQTGLAQTRGLDVVSTRRLREAARQRGAGDIERLGDTGAADVARQAGAGAIVTGSVYQTGPDIRIDARVEDLANGRILLAQTVRGTDVFALVDELAAHIRAGVGLRDASSIRRVADVSTSSLDAFRLYSHGTEAFVNARAGDARAAFEEAVRIDPTFAEAHLQLAAVSAFEGQPQLRREYLEKASRYADRLSESRRLFMQTQIARDAGRTMEAARLIDELIAKFPETEDAYTSAGLIYGGDLRDNAKVLELMRTGVRALPAAASVRNDYGYALVEAGEYAAGIREFEKYIELAPGEANPYDSLADGYLTSGSAEKGIEFFSRALATDPGFSGSRIGLSWSFAVMGRYDDALAAKPPLRVLEAYLLSRVGRHAEAAKLFQAGEQQAGENRNVAEKLMYIVMSSALALERSDPAAALRELSGREQLLADDTGTWKTRHRLLLQLMTGLAELRSGRKEAARARLPVMRQLYRPFIAEETFWYHTLEGEIALANGELERASAAFAEGEPVRRKPMRWQPAWTTILVNSFPLRDGGARVAVAKGDVADAIRLYRRLLTYDSDSKFIAAYEPRYVLAMARLLERSGDKPAALREYERFLDFWSRADADLPELAEARRAVARLRVR